MKFAFVLLAVFAVNVTCIGAEKVQVYILAGQSNMQGQGVVDLDHPMHYNGGRGILNNVMKNPKMKDVYAHIKDDNGEYIVRDDVFVRHVTKEETKTGRLTIGFTSYSGKHHIGPEFQFGHLVGDASKQPVLLIKTAWGGKSIYKDFRPPSSGGEVGPFYTQMLDEIKQGLSAMNEEFPQIGKNYELAGFVWFQGWNDMFDKDALSQYEDNLVNLVTDVRSALHQKQLPVIIGETGNMGEDAGENMKQIRLAQKNAADRLHNAAFVKTTAFARPKEESPNVTHGHHWFGNAESYFLIGDAMGKAMIKLKGLHRK
tara:strand:+ start:205 stop:1146 length:942 start_codon:yes stop_codon:yes gene_type:complete